MIESKPESVREWSQEQADETVVHTVLHDVTFTRGLGENGRLIEVVERVCPSCEYDRMLRETEIISEEKDYSAYHCNNPVCTHYHDGELEGV